MHYIHNIIKYTYLIIFISYPIPHDRRHLKEKIKWVYVIYVGIYYYITI